MAEINWGILGNALATDYAGKVQQGFEVGQSLRERRDMQAALRDYHRDPTNANALEYIGTRNPQLMASLEDRTRATTARNALATLVQPDSPPSVGSGGDGNTGAPLNALMPPPVHSSMPGMDRSPATLPAPPVTPGSLPVDSPGTGADPRSTMRGDRRALAMRDLAQSDPSTFMQLQKLNLEQRKAVGEQLIQQMDIGGRVMRAVMEAPPEQRGAIYQQLRTEIEGAGIADLPDQWDENSARARMHLGMKTLDALGLDLREQRLDWDIEDDRIDNTRADRGLDDLSSYRQGQLGNTRRGQDMTDARGRRGQDIGSRDRQRGQDIGSSDRQRGQDKSSEDRRRGQDLRSRVAGRRVAGVPVKPDEPMAKDANGNPLVVRNGKWVPAK